MVADSRKVSTLLLMGPLSTPYGGVGVVARGRLAGCPLISASSQEGRWGEGVVAGAQLGNMTRPDEGLHCTVLYFKINCSQQSSKSVVETSGDCMQFANGW